MSRYSISPHFKVDAAKAEEPWAKQEYVENVVRHLSAKDNARAWRDEQDAKLAQVPIASMRLPR